MIRRITFGALSLICFQISSLAADLPELQELRAKIAAQQEQIQRLQQSVNEQQKLLDRVLQAEPTSAPVNTEPVSTAAAPGPVRLVPAVVRSNRDIVNLPRAMQAPESKPSPLSISIGNTTFTPFGFMDATFFARSTNVGSGIGTNFAGIPLNNQPAGHLSETNFSAQNSRFGVRVDSTFMGPKCSATWRPTSYSITTRPAIRSPELRWLPAPQLLCRCDDEERLRVNGWAGLEFPDAESQGIVPSSE